MSDHFSTRAVHAGEDRRKPYGALTTPIVQTSTYTFEDTAEILVARFLADHPAVRQVYYPGLPSHPDHEVARRQMTGYGGVVSFEIDGDQERTSRFVDRLQLPYIGPTLGGVESIVQQQALFVSLDPAERRATGLRDNLVRYAVGIENVDDLIADLRQALGGI